MKPKNITIDDLAIMAQKGFSHVDEQFAQVHEQFARVDKQFGEVHRGLNAIRKELLGVVYRPEFDDLQDRVRELEHLIQLKKRTA